MRSGSTSYRRQLIAAACLAGSLALTATPAAAISARLATAHHLARSSAVGHLKATKVAARSVTLTWTTPKKPALVKIYVRRAKGGIAPGTIHAGRAIPVAVHGHKVVDGTVEPRRTYTYSVFERLKGRAVSVAQARTITTPNSLPPTTTTAQPAPAVSDLQVVMTSDEAELSWTNPTSTSFVGAVVRQSVGTTPPSSVTAGTAAGYTIRPNDTLLINGLTPTTTYSWSVFSSNGSSNLPNAAEVTGTTTTTYTAPGPVSDLQATHTDSSVELSWTNPSAANLTGVEIRRTVGYAAARSPDDGAFVAHPSAPATTADDDTIHLGTVYTYAAFAENALGEYSTAATVSVEISSVPSQAQECGAITSDTTWSPADQPIYELTCTVTVGAGVTLTIEPGTVIKADLNSELVNQGKLDAIGTSTDPIIMTSIRDDSVAGDTNGDGSATSPNEYDWYGIYSGTVASSASVPVLDASYVDLSYGDGISETNSATNISGCVLSNDINGIWATNYTTAAGTPTLDVESNQVSNSSGTGIRVADEFFVDPLSTAATGVGPTVANNNVVGSQYPYLIFGEVDLDKLSGNSASGNSVNVIELDGDVETDCALPAGLPFVIANPDDLDPGLDVAHGATLTLTPGAVLRFGHHTGLYVSGSLMAVGTAVQPILLTSEADPSIASVTSTPLAAPAAGDWSLVEADNTGSLDIEYASVDYGGGITAGGGSALIAHSTMSHANDGEYNAVIGLASAPGVPAQAAIDNTLDTSEGISATENGGTPPTIQGNVFLAGGNGGGIGISGGQIDPSTVTGNSGPTVISVFGTLGADSTMPANSMQMSAGPLTIPAGITFSLTSGQVLKLDGGQITVEGTLKAIGTANQPAVLTADTDDSAGYPISGGIAPKPGDAGLIFADPGAGDPQPIIDLEHTDLRYADGIKVYDEVVLTLIDDSIVDSAQAAVADISVNGVGAVDLEGNVIDGAGSQAALYDGGILVSQYVFVGPAPVVENNEVDNVTGAAIAVESRQLDGADLLGNTGKGDTDTSISLDGVLATDLTIPTTGLPWVVGNLTIPPSVSLTLDAGSVLKLGSFSASYPDLDVEGTLIANGTTTAPAIFTASTDQTVTPGAAAGPAPAAGIAWGAIGSTPLSGQPEPTIELDHTELRYSWGIQSPGWNASFLGPTKLSVTNSRFVDDDGESQISVSDATNPTEIDVDNDLVGSIDVWVDSSASAASPVVRNDTVTGGPISISSPDLLPSEYTGNSSTNAAIDELSLSGTLGEDVTVPTTGMPWAIGGLLVPPGRTLTIPAGAVLKADFGSDLSVEGSLISTATTNSPATFAGISDTSVGGATNDLAQIWSGGLQWYGIATRTVSGDPSPTVELPNVRILDAITALKDPSGDETISGTITNDQVGIAGPAKADDGTCPDGTVTASNVNWGTPTGPAPYGSGPGVSGCVVVKPWVGES